MNNAFVNGAKCLTDSAKYINEVFGSKRVFVLPADVLKFDEQNASVRQKYLLLESPQELFCHM